MKFTLANTISPDIFRAYDVRGIVGHGITPEAVYTLGIAIGSEGKAQGEDTFVIARDGRLSGPELVLALEAGLRKSGCDVINIGIVPTPVLYFATHTLPVRSGVMLTGSHNPADYNGLKIVIGGQSLSGEAIQGLYQRIQAKNFTDGQGASSTQDVIASYIARIKQDIKLQRPLRVVIDCGNGVSGVIAPQLFRALGCEVIELFCEIDGRFPNHHPDPAEPENLQSLIHAVNQHQADVGLAFDGDGDRLGVVTNKGEIIWPDRQLMLFAIDVLVRNPGATIIYDVKSSSHLEKVIKDHSGEPVMWKTGHSFIKTKLQQTQGLLAGEMSGHIFFKERWYGFDDALYAGARLLEILSARSQTSSEVFAAIPNSVNTPELKLPIAEKDKFSFMETFKANANFDGAKLTTIDGLRVDFKDGWGLIRPSNTTPCLVLRFEADNQASLERIQKLFRQQLLDVDKNLILSF